jgi:predicted ATP-grasp superfamily ATP-dependent carboligase
MMLETSSPQSGNLEPLLLLGASVRAAAWSMIRSGGIQPFCVDLFADADLQRVCSARAVPAAAFPKGLIEAARQAPPGPWLYTGALENRPDVIDAIARARPLWGNAADVVRKIRTPCLVAEALDQAGIPHPEITAAPAPGSGKTWLIKPRKSAGGAGIRTWQGQAVSRSCYCQERIEGDPCSALYIGRPDGARFLGATRQLIGLPWLNARGFRYCGNVGPLPLSPPVRRRLQDLGEVLAGSFSLRGFFGIDFILTDDVPWPVEINPRYTAGIEVLERATGKDLFSCHRRVFAPAPTGGPTPRRSPSSGRPPGAHFCGKAILFAKVPLVFPPDGPWRESLTLAWTGAQDPDYADIPHPHDRVGAGQPILTLFAHAAAEADCLEFLREKAQALDRVLFG